MKENTWFTYILLENNLLEIPACFKGETYDPRRCFSVNELFLTSFILNLQQEWVPWPIERVSLEVTRGRDILTYCHRETRFISVWTAKWPGYLDWMTCLEFVGILGSNRNGGCWEATACQCSFGSGQSILRLIIRLVNYFTFSLNA